VISTDLHQLSVHGPAFDLPTTLSKFLHLGMSLPEVIEAATVRPAAVLGLDAEVGTLRPGARADVALFRLHEGRFPLQDIHGNVREARRLLRNTATFVGGRELERLPLPPRAPWTEEPIWPDVQIPFTEKQRALHELGRTPDAMMAVAEERAGG
jgi:dihydroorotase